MVKPEQVEEIVCNSVHASLSILNIMRIIWIKLPIIRYIIWIEEKMS